MRLKSSSEITGVILAGGKGRRMGGKDKGLIDFEGKPLVNHVIDRLQPQVNTLLISANRNKQAYQRLGYPVIEDSLADYQGPLAGFASAMQQAETAWILTAPCDGPYLPQNLAQRLITAVNDNQADLAVAHNGERMQPVYALIPIALLQSLTRFLDQGDRKIDLWYAQHNTALADFSDAKESFFNINSPADTDKTRS